MLSENVFYYMASFRSTIVLPKLLFLLPELYLDSAGATFP